MRQLICSLLVLLMAGAFCLAPTVVQAADPATNFENGYRGAMSAKFGAAPYTLEGFGYDIVGTMWTTLPALETEVDAIASDLNKIEFGYDLAMDTIYGPGPYDLTGLGYSLASIDVISAKVNTINAAVAANTTAIADLNAKLDTIIDLLTTPQGRRPGWNE